MKIKVLIALGGIALVVGLIGIASMPPRLASKSGTVYHGNTNSRIYHEPSCRDYNCKNCAREFNSKEEAHQAGYRECKICRP